MPVRFGAVRFFSVLTLCVFLSLTGLPALAQDAPPHEGEGARRQAPGAKAPAAKTQASGYAAAKKQPAAPAKKKAPVAKNNAKPPLRSLDKNHDGRVTHDEYLAGAKKRFAKADANRDGVVSKQEAQAAKAALREKQTRRDAKRVAEGKPVKAKKKSGKAAKPYLSTLDANKDGRVSQKEYLARREKRFKEMDVNHDGVVSREEARNAKKKVQERREAKKAAAKAKRLRKIEEARQKSRQAAMSSPGPEFVGTVTPPPAATPPAQPPAPPAAPLDLPLTPIAPGVPAQAEPET
jgi:Ca2+-binding EF-hand superfamily protein